ncbi:MAG: baseplate J/gp47 family protein [Anaerovoracaceae bacterium]
MLANIRLDDEMFSEIAENAGKLITKYSPEWTDRNAHDPGITFLELFAWMKEIQQYRMNRTGEETRRQFLKLLGLAPALRKPAEVCLSVKSREDVTLPKGTPFYAGDIPFETEEAYFVSAASVTGGAFVSQDTWMKLPEHAVEQGNNMQFPMFGKTPSHGGEFRIFFDRPVKQGEPFSLYVHLSEDYEIRRNPVTEEFLPLTDIRWQYFSRDGWRDAEVLSDGTSGLIRSGRVCLLFEDEMQENRDHAEAGGYALRAVFEAGQFDVPPVLAGISCSSIPVIQKETLADFRDVSCAGPADLAAGPSYGEMTMPCRYFVRREAGWEETPFSEIPWPAEVRIVSFHEDYLHLMNPGEGDGFPYQQFFLELDHLMADGFVLMVEEAPGVYQQWEQVSDFDLSGPTDRHYIFREKTGELVFGDCEQGMAPEGALLVIRCARTMAEGGNVRPGSIRQTGELPYLPEINNELSADGGADGETIDECFRRYLRSAAETDRAVTFADYEEIVRRTPGLMIKSCRAFPAARLPRSDGSVEENCVSIVVRPYSGKSTGALSAGYVENIHRYLKGRKMIGTKIQILSPEYVGIHLFAELSVLPYYRNAEEEIRSAVEAYFAEISGEFGNAVQYSTIYGILDTLDCVSRVGSLVLDAQGRNIRRNLSGDVLLPANGMAYLKEAEFALTVSE